MARKGTSMNQSRDNRIRAKSGEWQIALKRLGDDEGQADDEVLIDILADLRHWCDWKGISYAKADKAAQKHWRKERRSNP